MKFEPVASSNGGMLTRYLVELWRRQPNDGPLVAFGSWTLTVSRPDGQFVEIERTDLPDGIYGATIRSICGDIPQGNRAGVVEFTNGPGPFGPDVEVPPPPVCALNHGGCYPR